MTATRHFLLAAGGTGGHMLPAYALAGELIARGHRVALVSDDRGLKIPGAPGIFNPRSSLTSATRCPRAISSPARA